MICGPNSSISIAFSFLCMEKTPEASSAMGIEGVRVLPRLSQA
ncbi:hypothetical protein TPChic_0575a [Treponema pallidum subsp. pallidum str. Chicago]|nr:hypothetical protein TPChic_0575a [Treponema pallidum subsp. pallidum str. Chicago]